MAKQKRAAELAQRKEKPKSSAYTISTKWFPLIIFGFSFLLYFNSVFNGYNLDDELVTQKHRLTSKGIGAIPEIFRSPYFENKEGFKYEYRPIVLVSFAIENSLFGENVFVSHLINVLLYSLLCVLLFFVLKNLLKQYNILLPFIVTLIFTAHPIHTEVVASIKNRDEILSLSFGLLSLFFVMRFVEQKNIFQLLLIPVFFLLGILSKSTVITFALLIPLSLIIHTAKPNFKTLLLITATLALPAVFYSRLYSVYQQIGFVVALFAVVIVFYSFRNYVTVWEKIKLLALKLQILVSTQTAQEQIESKLDFTFLRNKTNLFLTALTIIIVLVASVAGIYTGRIWLCVVSLIVLAVAFILARNELKAIFITPISIISLLAISKFSMSISLIEASLIVFLALQILSKNITFRTIGLVNYLLLALVSVFITHSYFFFIIFIFAGFFHKKLFPVSLVIVLVSVVIFFKKLNFVISGTKAFKPMFLYLPFIYFCLFLLWKQYYRLLSRAVVISIPLFILLHSLLTPPAVNREREASFQKTYEIINTLKAVDVTPVQALRPIAFIESPIDKDDPLRIKLGTAMVVLGKYLKLIFIPYPLSYYYGYAYIAPTDFFSFVPLFIFLIHAILFGAGVFLIRKIPLLSFAILFYLISISVFSNLIILLPGMMGDRFLLIPSIGFCFFIVFALTTIFKQNMTDHKVQFSSLQMPLRISLGVLLVLYSAITFSRNADWKDRITLFSHDIAGVENSAQAQNLLGLHLFIESGKETDAAKQKKMREDAAEHLKKALEIYPQFLNASFDLARTYDALQRREEAYTYYANSIKIDSTFVAACFPMAIIQQNKGNLVAAISLYEKFATQYSHQMEVYANLSFAYFKLEEYDSSIAVNKRALVIKPNTFEPTLNIAKTFMYTNRKDSALIYFLQAQRINPADQSTAQSIATLQREQK